MTKRQNEMLGPEYRPRSRPQLEIADFQGTLPPRVMPSGARVLERDGNLLFVRHYAYGEVVPRSHLKIWRTLVAMGSHPDAPGSVSVMCLWGVQGTTREMRVIDWAGDQGARPSTDDEIRAAISRWWALARRQ